MEVDTILIGLLFAVALGLRVWAAKEYTEFYNALDSEKQRALVRRAMQSGS